MDVLSRRRFLLASTMVGGGAVAAGVGGLGLAELLATATGQPPGDEDARVDKVVLVTLYGGNDGLSTLIPYADPAYQSARPELAYAPEKVLHLDDSLGLNPALSGLKRLWSDGRLAIVPGAGYPVPDRSHFRSMDIWQTASPTMPVNTGWVGRWLDGVGAPVEAAVSFEPVLPPLLVGRTHIGACVSYRGLTLPDWIDPALVAGLGRGEPGESEMQARAAEGYANLLAMRQITRGAGDPLATGRGPAEPEVPATGTGGENELATQLALVARCVEIGVPTRVYSVSLGGFDTHAQERGTHEVLLRHLDRALTGFVDRMDGTAAGRRVAVVVYSEFGRRVRANASEGTDHGTAGPMFVLGPRVVGGWYGEMPSLTDLEDGDLKATSDFRDVFAAVLATVLDADPERYLDGYRARPLPIFPSSR